MITTDSNKGFNLNYGNISAANFNHIKIEKLAKDTIFLTRFIEIENSKIFSILLKLINLKIPLKFLNNKYLLFLLFNNVLIYGDKCSDNDSILRPLRGENKFQ